MKLQKKKKAKKAILWQILPLLFPKLCFTFPLKKIMDVTKLVVIEFSGVQFWSEIILVISNRIQAALSFFFEVSSMSSDQIEI